MPATRATASTSPLLTSRFAMADVVSGCMKTLQRAPALRCDGSLGVTSTMRARPSGSRWVNSRSGMSAECKRERATEPETATPRSSAADLAHGSARPDERDLTDGGTGPLGAHPPGDHPPPLVVGAPVAEHGTKVELVGGKQAGPELTLGGEADPVAVGTE